MEKDTQTEKADAWKNAVKEVSDLILQHSWDRMKLVQTPHQPEHKAYMALALAASEAIKAFVALDESMK